MNIMNQYISIKWALLGCVRIAFFLSTASFFLFFFYPIVTRQSVCYYPNVKWCPQHLFGPAFVVWASRVNRTFEKICICRCRHDFSGIKSAFTLDIVIVVTWNMEEMQARLLPCVPSVKCYDMSGRNDQKKNSSQQTTDRADNDRCCSVLSLSPYELQASQLCALFHKTLGFKCSPEACQHIPDRTDERTCSKEGRSPFILSLLFYLRY